MIVPKLILLLGANGAFSQHTGARVDIGGKPSVAGFVQRVVPENKTGFIEVAGSGKLKIFGCFRTVRAQEITEFDNR